MSAVPAQVDAENNSVSAKAISGLIIGINATTILAFLFVIIQNYVR